jgi:hypothetical protein
MPGHPSSSPKPSRFTNVHTLATSFAALAGVAIAGYQALGPGHNAPPAAAPVQVTLAVQPGTPKVDQVVAEKGDALGATSGSLAQGALFVAALKDGSDQRYRFSDLFDNDPATRLSITKPDHEVNVLVSFAGSVAQSVSTIDYEPPANAATAATQLDVMVLPDGQMSAAGQPIQSYTLQTTPGKQSFIIPDKAMGKALWLRVAGPDDADSVAVGEFTIRK